VTLCMKTGGYKHFLDIPGMGQMTLI